MRSRACWRVPRRRRRRVRLLPTPRMRHRVRPPPTSRPRPGSLHRQPPGAAGGDRRRQAGGDALHLVWAEGVVGGREGVSRLAEGSTAVWPESRHPVHAWAQHCGDGATPGPGVSNRPACHHGRIHRRGQPHERPDGERRAGAGGLGRLVAERARPRAGGASGYGRDVRDLGARDYLQPHPGERGGRAAHDAGPAQARVQGARGLDAVRVKLRPPGDDRDVGQGAHNGFCHAVCRPAWRADALQRAFADRERRVRPARARLQPGHRACGEGGRRANRVHARDATSQW